jgi:hypothetical protein
MNARRAFLATTALIAPALAIAGCSLVSPANVATVEQIIAKVQAVMPYVSGIAMIIGAFVPGVSGAVALVQAGLGAAANVFATINSTMTVAATQPLIGKIAVSITGALTAADQAVAGIPSGAVQTQAQTLLAEARVVLADLSAFASGKPLASAAFRATVPVHLFIRPVV